jgi:Uma2 family endonuclease
MQEYVETGVKLGWLIDPQQRQVEIDRIGQPIEILQVPIAHSEEEMLPGFSLNLVP